MSRFMLALMVISLFACSPRSTSTTIVEPTQALTIPVPSDWAGAMTHADHTTESVIIHFTETGGTLKVEPRTKTYEITDIQHSSSSISFNVIIENEMNFSGEFDGSQITGRAEQSGQTESFALLPLSSDSKESLNGLLGTYQFDSGESLLINLAPEYNTSGLYFFGQGLMLTHFGTGAIRALYPIAADTFLVGSARAIGYPFNEQITFQHEAEGNVTG